MELEATCQHLGVGRNRIDIDRYQFRHGFSLTRGLDPVFERTDVAIKASKGVLVSSARIYGRHVADDHPNPSRYVRPSRLNLEQKDVDDALGAVAEILALDGQNPIEEFEVFASLNAGRVKFAFTSDVGWILA